MEELLNIKFLVDFKNENHDKLLHLIEMLNSKDWKDRDLAHQIIKDNHELNPIIYPNNKTIKFLKSCIPYYEYIGVGKSPDNHVYKHMQLMEEDVLGQPWNNNIKSYLSHPPFDRKNIEKVFGLIDGHQALSRLAILNDVKYSVGNVQHIQVYRDQLMVGLYRIFNKEIFIVIQNSNYEFFRDSFITI